MFPNVMTILPTYQCTAACKECCFECTPHVHGKIPIDRILNYIDEAAETFPALELICFSGGECFLLRKDLDTAIARITEHGLKSRCVTNGYWATSPHIAYDRLERLKEAGLTELNISTGDDHQEFVPFERVVNGVIAAAELDIFGLIVVEGFVNSRFKVSDAIEHPRIQDFKMNNPKAHLLEIFQNIWMPFHKDRVLDHQEELYRTPETLEKNSAGCDNVLHNLVVTPDESLASCCGLTMEHIPEMKLGKLTEHSMKTLIDQGLNDFLKRWLWLDGPDAILFFAHQKDNRVPFPKQNVHPCEACAQFYLDPLARRVVREHWHEIRDDVLLRFEMKTRLLQEGKSYAHQKNKRLPPDTRVGRGDC